MLKVTKKFIKKPKNIQDDEHLKNQNNLKNSIKNLFISNQSKKKTIGEYAQLTTQIRDKYSKLQSENKKLKYELEKYKNYIEQLQQKPSRKFYEKRIRKRKYYNSEREYENEQGHSDDSDPYITEIRKRKKKPKKRIIYEDEIDGISDQETDPHFSEEEQEVKKTKPQINKKKQSKKIQKRNY